MIVITMKVGLVQSFIPTSDTPFDRYKLTLLPTPSIDRAFLVIVIAIFNRQNDSKTQNLFTELIKPVTIFVTSKPVTV